MHPRTQELLTHLAACHAESRAALDAVPPDQRTRKPAPDRWSAAEVVEHLAVVERSVAGLLRRGLEQVRAAGPLPVEDRTSLVLPTLDAELLLDRERRIVAIARVVPTGTVDAEAAWSQFDEARRATVEMLKSVDGLRTDAVHAPHFALGELEFAQWIAFLGLHERRHAAQIREILGQR